MKNRNLCALAVASAVTVLMSVSAQAQGRPDLALAALQAGKARHAPGELLVQFRHGIDRRASEVALDSLGARVIRTLRREAQRSDGKGDLHLVRVPAGIRLADAMQRLQAEAAVDFAEPNWEARLDARTPDPLYADGRMWGMYGIDSPVRQNTFGSGAGTAAAAGKKCDRNLHVGMIDAGIMVDHVDLAPNIWINPNDPLNGIDDDGNGLIDDVNGWNFRNKNAKVFNGSEDNHGTHTSGTIGAIRFNDQGVVGVCDRVTIIGAKAFGGIFGTGRTADIIEAIDYITDLKVVGGINIVVTNNSWGGSVFSQATYDAYVRQTGADILVVASAGNNGSDADVSPSYPAAFDLPNIISVAALTSSGALASYSNYGKMTVDIGAPGSGVYSSTVGSRVGGVYQSSYGSLDGTSMAGPHVTGAALLFKSLHPNATPAQVKAAILAAATPTASMANKSVTGGRLNVSGF